MKEFPKSLQQKLQRREEENALRQLSAQKGLIDFTSNDYLGFARNETLFRQTHDYLIEKNALANGATGSRLLSGNHDLYTITEGYIAQFHEVESALIFNSGYDANVGFFSSVPQRQDIILFDELCHASIRDGIQLSYAKSYKFGHNDFDELELLLQKFASPANEVYVATESIFSMDGDAPQLESLVMLSDKYHCRLVIDEAHALGVFGENGNGLVQQLGVQDRIFARIMTFGKALGCHGAAVLGSNQLKNYLINFARSFIYTTALPPHSVATIQTAYHYLQTQTEALENLRENIRFFNAQKVQYGLKPLFVYSKSAIQCAIIPGNEKVKTIARQLQEKGFDVKPILSPTVPEGQERLRLCLHSYNSGEEITEVLRLLSDFVF